MRILWGLVCAVAALMSGPVASAEFKTVEGPGFSLVTFRGPINNGDAEKFLKATEGLTKVNVLLESPGGLVKEALEIGATIRTRGYSTLVAPGTDGCYSACALIWVSGARRYMAPDSVIGFHAAYVKENGEYKESGVGNAEIGAYLTTLGLRIEAIRFFTTAGPNEFLTLSPADARALGVEIFEIEGDKVLSPEAKPTLDVFADRFVSYGVLNSKCNRFFNADSETLKRGMEQAFNEGNAVATSEEWITVWTRILDSVDEQFREHRVLPTCIKLEANLRQQGQPTGVSGPAFECSAAGTPNEFALCKEPGLWSKDRAISSIYFWIRDGVDKATKKRMLAVQRSWLKIRDECSGDVACLTKVYDTRIVELKMIDPQGE